ncbi:MAG: hypothetical protein C0625_17325 [Arcobacter sp.]|nr:MAG: hypothetical protein C0625_17325 [Arcobacter sp.]
MNKYFIKTLKFSLTSVFLTISLTSCTEMVRDLAQSSPLNHKSLVGSNNFHSLVKNLVDKSASKLKQHLQLDDVILVSDFVNLDNLKNRSKLGFLLSDHLKDSLLNHNIMVREVELSENFQYGRHGLNLLTREQKDINKKYVDSQYAVVGTYTITTKSLIVFIKFIDITNGNILSSSNAETTIDPEILELEGIKPERRLIIAPMVL